MSIKEGNFCIGNVQINRDTRISDFTGRSDYMAFPGGPGRGDIVLLSKPPTVFLGMECSAEVRYRDGKIKEMKLVPYMGDTARKTCPSRNMREARYRWTVSEMKAEFGMPDQETYSRVLYGFPGGTMTASIEENDPSGNGEGHVTIEFSGQSPRPFLPEWTGLVERK